MLLQQLHYLSTLIMKISFNRNFSFIEIDLQSLRFFSQLNNLYQPTSCWTYMLMWHLMSKYLAYIQNLIHSFIHLLMVYWESYLIVNNVKYLLPQIESKLIFTKAKNSLVLLKLYEHYDINVFLLTTCTLEVIYKQKAF